MQATPLLELRKVSKSYPNQAAIIDEVSLSVQAGEIFGLLGESGAGKSTLLQLAANLINPDLGRVWMDGTRLALPSELLIPGHPEIKMVHQDYQLAPALSVRENIRYALRYYEPAYRDMRIAELLALCQLEALADRPAKLLSGGEKQRTAIARALAEEARVLLLDEPFAHLDLLNSRRLSATIRASVAEQEAACIFVTHNAAEALGLADQMGILQQGRLIQVGTPQAIYHHPINTYVAQLSGIANIVPLNWVQQQWGKAIGHPLADGEHVMLRPEQLRLSTRRPAPTAPVARVREAIFEGSRYRLVVALAGITLECYADQAIGEGQEVYLFIE